MNKLGKPQELPYNIFYDQYEQAGEAPDPSLQHFFDYEQVGEAPDPSLQHFFLWTGFFIINRLGKLLTLP